MKDNNSFNRDDAKLLARMMNISEEEVADIAIEMGKMLEDWEVAHLAKVLDVDFHEIAANAEKFKRNLKK